MSAAVASKRGNCWTSSKCFGGSWPKRKQLQQFATTAPAAERTVATLVGSSLLGFSLRHREYLDRHIVNALEESWGGGKFCLR